jgi:hypothetical protein
VRKLGDRTAPVAIRDLLSRVVRGRSPIVSVERRRIPYWQERGWVRERTGYRGNYQTDRAVFCGYATEHPGGQFSFYLYRPSEQIASHSHWVCFTPTGEGWYLVHMGRQPHDVSSGILTVERLISEAYGS